MTPPIGRAGSGGESRHRHAVFAHTYAAVAHLAERGSFGRLRRRVLAPAHGRLLIVGAGQAHDLAHLPAAVTEVVAVEPDPVMRRLGRHRLAHGRARAWYVGGVAEALPVASASVDTALVALTLCSVTDPAAAAAELRRVLRPGGTLLVLEHVRAEPAGTVSRLQDALDRPWGLVSGGCHLNRDTKSVLAAAGFDVSGLERRRLGHWLPIVDGGIAGTARPQ